MPPVQFKNVATPVFISAAGPITVSFNISPGDFVIAYLWESTVTTGTHSVTDNGGNTYTPGPSQSTPSNSAILSFYTIAFNSATTITANVSIVITLSGMGSVSYTNAFALGNTGNIGVAAGSNPRAITGTMTSTNTLMSAGFAARGTAGIVAVSGTIRTSTSNSLVIMENANGATLTCSFNSAQPTGQYSAVFLELLPGPVITSITPNGGTQGTTVPVTLTGTNFTGATSVTVNPTGITVANLTIVNDSTITASFVIGSAASIGIRNVTVTTPTGTSNVVNFAVLNVLLPTLSNMSPNTASVVNPTFTVTFHGTNLTGTTAVNVGGAPIVVSNITVISSTVVTANFTIQGTTTGTFNISLTTPNGTSNTVPFTLTLRPAGQAIFYDRIASMWAFRTRRR